VIDYLGGVDEIHTHAVAVYDAACIEVLGAVPDSGARFLGIERVPAPSAGSFWGRISLETVVQDSITVGQLDNSGKTRRRNAGYLLIELFAPKSDDSNYSKLRAINSKMRDATVNAVTPGRVIFERVRVDDSPKTNEQWLSICLWAEWQFDEIL
jgi:hypothetical protein